MSGPGSAEEARKDAEEYAGKAADQEETASTVVQALNANTLAQLAVAARLGQVSATLSDAVEKLALPSQIGVERPGLDLAAVLQEYGIELKR